jgi:ABC-type multidrug transport system fused ATPase/permease subunit
MKTLGGSIKRALSTNGKRGAPQMQGSRREQVKLLLGESRWAVVRLAFYSIISGLIEAATLGVIAQVASAIVKGSKHVHANIAHVHIDTTLPTLIKIAFGLTILRLILQIPLSLLPSRIAADVQLTLRTKLFDAFSRASWGVQAQDREGQLQELMSKQVAQATTGALQATSLMTSVFTFLVLLAAAVALSPIAATVVGVTSVLMFGLLRPIRTQGVRSARALSKSQVEYAGAIAEAIRVAQEMQVFGVTGAQRERIGRFVARQNSFFYRTQVLVKLAGNVYQSLIYILLVAGIAGLYVAGGSHSATIGGVILLLLRAGTTGQAAQTNYQGLAQSLPFIERTQQALQRYIDSKPPDGGEPLPQVSEVAFENVSFGYNAGRPVLSELSFEVAAGEVIGIVGPSGAGKSTLVQLLLRLRSPDDGTYLVNGKPADCFSREEWHLQVSFVPQEPRLLHASVAENIRFYRDISDADVERAARLARIHDDIAGWAKGYQTVVGPRADAVSGGQQQRICLARALAARPHILVLDEPTSALDPESEALIGESLKALKSELTLFIIAHRMSTLDICDRVMVIVDGRLAGFDTKALLQTTNEYYRHASQLALGSTA